MGTWSFSDKIDNQVKIRGYRIELGEIESQLLKHEAITEAIVVAREETGGQKYLCAYFVAERKLTVAELRDVFSAGIT